MSELKLGITNFPEKSEISDLKTRKKILGYSVQEITNNNN
jgi:hypothetical protein